MFGLIREDINKKIENNNVIIQKFELEKSKTNYEYFKANSSLTVLEKLHRKEKNLANTTILLMVLALLTALSVLLSLPTTIIAIITFTFSSMAEFNAINDLKETKREYRILNKDNKYNKSDLLNIINVLSSKIEHLNNQIQDYRKENFKYNNKLLTYERFDRNRINIVSVTEQDEICKSLMDNEQLQIFDNLDEYNNYKSYDNEFVKKELIRSKLLEKKL